MFRYRLSMSMSMYRYTLDMKIGVFGRGRESVSGNKVREWGEEDQR